MQQLLQYRTSTGISIVTLATVIDYKHQSRNKHFYIPCDVVAYSLDFHLSRARKLFNVFDY